ncbi:MAG: ribosome assembly cofactor RimP [Muribaculaceae bacterium]|nr:ribosome assembly cofactor RimP [Muribaculaceae bacterium]MDE6134824.1 ribosome assembly cofactor RimP [Muribaculaceae bacterium]
MIDKSLLIDTVNGVLAGTDAYLVDVEIGKDNSITVEIDSDSGVDIDTCAAVTRHIEEVFDRDAEDYSLEVGSAGITSPLKVRRQFDKNLGNDVEVLTRDGRKLHGVLSQVSPGNADDRDVAFTIEIPVKIKEPGSKKSIASVQSVELTSQQCKYVRYDLKF